MESWDHIIIGGSIAGMSAAREIRRLQPQASILVINRENQLPYKRTSLSKKMHIHVTPGELQLQDETFFEESGIDIMPGTEVIAILPESNNLKLDDGELIAWQRLLVASGSLALFPANLRRHDTGDCFTFRTWDDMEALKMRLARAHRVLISGMGSLGIELAEQIRLLGKNVTLMGTSPQLLNHHLTPRAAEILEASLQANQINLRYQEEILSFTSDNGRITITTVHGQSDFDILVFCTGATPNTELARNSGMLCKKGILVDRYLRSSLPEIWAAGDVAEHPDGKITGLWHAAEHQGIIAGRNMAGSPEPWNNPGFRMKCAVFDTYAFSMIDGIDPNSIQVVEQESQKRYIAIFAEGDSTRGIVMLNDPDNAPLYQDAVRQNWSPERVLALFNA